MYFPVLVYITIPVTREECFDIPYEKIRRVYSCSHNAYSKNICLKKSRDSGYTLSVFVRVMVT
jgi:hypothetical protein